MTRLIQTQLVNELNKNSTGVVALLSGGLDSLVSLAWVLEATAVSVKTVLSFDYGQRPVKQELAAAVAMAGHYKLPHQIITLPWLKQLLPTGLAQHGQSHLQGALGVNAVWVPNRNGVFLNIAASWAEALGANRITFGANLEEAEAGFPDNSTEAWQRLNTALELFTQNQVQVLAPVSALTKKEIMALGLQLNAPLHYVWSCYEAGEAHCGQCASCLLLKAAAVKNNWPEAFKHKFSYFTNE
jgi:7-cyano-7-deazaguanine synthase